MKGYVNREYALLKRLMGDVERQWEGWRLEAGWNASPAERNAMFNRLMVNHPDAREIGLQRGMNEAEIVAAMNRVFADQVEACAATARRRLILATAAAPSPN
jgi:hypothetical protein